MESLKRTLNQRDLIFIVVGTTIGSGIFLTPGRVLSSSGSAGLLDPPWGAGRGDGPALGAL